MLHSPRHPATAANSASESSGPVESNASAAQPGPSTKRQRATDGHASAAQPGSAAASSSEAASSDVCSAVRGHKNKAKRSKARFCHCSSRSPSCKPSEIASPCLRFWVSGVFMTFRPCLSRELLQQLLTRSRRCSVRAIARELTRSSRCESQAKAK